ncbi:MAG: methionine adenosyltransferase [Candidatus Micrarchaeaceae archaeon]
MRNISIERLDLKPVSEQATEYVERKGVGHPDSLIDGIVDETSHALCREYINSTGTILHHNVDKGLIIGGTAKVTYGSGKITKKIEVIVTGRATSKFSGKSIDVNQIAEDVTRKYLKDNTRFLDLDEEVVIRSKIAKGSEDLTHIFSRKSEVPLANDTSFGIGFAPFSDVERLVLETEHYLNGKEYKASFPAVGEDIKVMGCRNGDRITLTVAIAFVAQFVNSKEEYYSMKERVTKDILRFASRITKKEVVVEVNTGDDAEGIAPYLTKSGLSCENGDDGSVGRGNRVNGLITPFRHMSLEAAAGKNPINHIGKIYNLLATQLADDIVKQYPQIKECDIAALSQIGKRIDQPLNLNINLILENGANFDNIRSKVNYIADGWLDRIGEFTTQIALGKYKTF